MSATGLHISLAAEPVFHIGDFVITNSMFTSVIVSTLLIGFALLVNRNLTNTIKPKGIQNFAEWIVESFMSLVFSVTNDMRKAQMFFPLTCTFFLFILINNWFGLLPGVGSIVTAGAEVVEHVEEEVTHQPLTDDSTDLESELSFGTELDAHGEEIITHQTETAETQSTEITMSEVPEEHKAPTPFLRPGTADLNTTIALGLIAVLSVQFFGYRYLKFSYFKKFLNFSSPIMFYVGILELISEISKIISFAFRLFGNIFAGEVLLVVIGSLVGLIAPIPFYGLEVFVGFIQALVFSMLSLVLINMATISHDEH